MDVAEEGSGAVSVTPCRCDGCISREDFMRRQEERDATNARNISELVTTVNNLSNVVGSSLKRQLELNEQLVASGKAARLELDETKTNLIKVAKAVKEMKTADGGAPQSELLKLQIELGHLRDRNATLEAKLADRKK